MDIDVGCHFVFEVPYPAHAIVMVEPHSNERPNLVSEQFDVEPYAPSSIYFDHFGNVCRRITLDGPTAELTFRARMISSGEPDPIHRDAMAVPPNVLPAEALTFLLPSRYCESDQMVDRAVELFGHMAQGWDQVQAICDWVHAEVRFDYMSSSPSHSAMSVLEARVGVCRDFTHLAIGMCRALNLPTRYVFGYLPDIGIVPNGSPMDFCAWMEVYLGDRWHTFDPRNNRPRFGRVVIGRGRDAADVAMVTSFGLLTLVDMTVQAEEAPTAAD